MKCAELTILFQAAQLTFCLFDFPSGREGYQWTAYGSPSVTTLTINNMQKQEKENENTLKTLQRDCKFKT